MKDILDIYQKPYNPEVPVICMYEKPYQILDENLKPLPVKLESVKRLIVSISKMALALYSYLSSC